MRSLAYHFITASLPPDDPDDGITTSDSLRSAFCTTFSLLEGNYINDEGTYRWADSLPIRLHRWLFPQLGLAGSTRIWLPCNLFTVYLGGVDSGRRRRSSFSSSQRNALKYHFGRSHAGCEAIARFGYHSEILIFLFLPEIADVIFCFRGCGTLYSYTAGRRSIGAISLAKSPPAGGGCPIVSARGTPRTCR